MTDSPPVQVVDGFGVHAELFVRADGLSERLLEIGPDVATAEGVAQHGGPQAT